MLKFKGNNNLYDKGYFFSDYSWIEILLDGEEIIVRDSNRVIINYIETSVNTKVKYYLEPNFDSEVLSLIEL
jgi:hypothetical protein